MLKGIAFGLSACFIWGLIFIIPQYMSNFSPVEIAFGRFLFYGGISLLLLLKARLKGSCCYPLSVWTKALLLSFLSSSYLWVVLGIRYASPGICALIMGISPITIAFYGNWKQKEGNLRFLILSSFFILIGLIMINAPHILSTNSFLEYSIGLICCLISLISWSAYVVLNSHFLKSNPHIVSHDWTTIQGVVTLFWALAYGVIGTIFWGNESGMLIDLGWNPDTATFLIGCAILGLLCSWIGTFLWNKASLYLPVSLTGQLLIFETVFGLLFVYTFDQQLPTLMECGGIALLLGAVIHGIRTLSLQPPLVYASP